MATAAGGATSVRAPVLMVTMMILSSAVGLASAGLEEDCRSTIVNDLTHCQAYSTGKEDKPSSDCCSSVTQVKDKKPKCLCYAVEAANTTSFKEAGLQIQRIFSLSSECKITGGNISDCPKLLDIPSGDPRNAFFNGSILPGGKEIKSTDSAAVGLAQAGAVIGAVASAVFLSLL